MIEQVRPRNQTFISNRHQVNIVGVLLSNEWFVIAAFAYAAHISTFVWHMLPKSVVLKLNEITRSGHRPQSGSC